MLSFRANLLHGSLKTCKANWFLHWFFDLLHTAGISGLFSQMRQINRAWVFIQNRERKGELGDTDRKGGVQRALGESVNEGKWERKRVKMAAVILLLEPVQLTLTMAWEADQSVSIHNESGVKWPDSSAGPHEWITVSHGHSFFTLLLPIFV